VVGENISSRKIPMERDNLLKEIKKIYNTHDQLLEHIGANNLPNAKRKIDRERIEFERTKSQLQEVVGALEVDNWRNAVVRAKSLLNKLEREGLPPWLRTISPAWVNKIPPSAYKRWLHFCREQFLVALGELQEDAEIFTDLDVEKELETLKELYLTLPPGEFIERISQFVTSTDDDEDDDELIE
jgi:hypothetical protein